MLLQLILTLGCLQSFQLEVFQVWERRESGLTSLVDNWWLLRLLDRLVVSLTVEAALRMVFTDLPVADFVRLEYFQTPAKLEGILWLLLRTRLINRNGHLIISFGWHVCIDHWCCWVCSCGMSRFRTLRRILLMWLYFRHLWRDVRSWRGNVLQGFSVGRVLLLDFYFWSRLLLAFPFCSYLLWSFSFWSCFLLNYNFWSWYRVLYFNLD